MAQWLSGRVLHHSALSHGRDRSLIRNGMISLYYTAVMISLYYTALEMLGVGGGGGGEREQQLCIFIYTEVYTQFYFFKYFSLLFLKYFSLVFNNYYF